MHCLVRHRKMYLRQQTFEKSINIFLSYDRNVSYLKFTSKIPKLLKQRV